MAMVPTGLPSRQWRECVIVRTTARMLLLCAAGLPWGPVPQPTRACCVACCAVTRDELLKLQQEFQKLSKDHAGNHATIDRSGFEKALALVKVRESDQEILGRLFTLFDHSGDGQINFKEFIVGVSAIVRGTLEEKLQCTCSSLFPLLQHAHAHLAAPHSRSRDPCVQFPFTCSTSITPGA